VKRHVELIQGSVIGVNLLEADSGPRVIKPWDDRLTESGIESGVDDEVGHPVTVYDEVIADCASSADPACPIYTFVTVTIFPLLLTFTHASQ
jgi:hypothetical protein